jgi:hypothetical protein
MPTYTLLEKLETKFIPAAGYFSEAPAKTRAKKNLELFGHPREYRIERNGKPWLIGRSIVPRSGNVRIEWRDDYAESNGL